MSSKRLSLVALAAACAPTPRTLHGAFDGTILVRPDLNAAQFSWRDTLGVAIVSAQFNAITPENALKWASLHPRPGTYDFAAADQYVAFGERYGMFIVGHTLVWHKQTPQWVFQDSSGNPVSRDTLLERLRDHIHTVVGRYRGRIRGWDVVNEALNEDGTLRRTPWLAILGDDYLASAYRFAREADPDAELYYNDYSLENAPKRRGAVQLVTRLRDQGVPITAVGLQGHNRMDWPSPAQEDSTIDAFAGAGFRVMITELAVDGLPRATRAPRADRADTTASRAALPPFVNAPPHWLPRALARRCA